MLQEETKIVILIILNFICVALIIPLFIIIPIISFILLKKIIKRKYYLLLVPLIFELLPIIVLIIGFNNQPYIYEQKLWGLPLYYLFDKIFFPYLVIAAIITLIIVSIQIIKIANNKKVSLRQKS